MKLLHLLAIFGILSAGILLCSCAGPGGAANPPARIDLSGAQGLYLQGGGASRHARAITAPGGATLMKLTASTPTEATFEDAGGQPVTVGVTRTLQLDAEYLLMEYTLDGASGIAVVTLATGELRELAPAPDNWERIRCKSGVAYYVSTGHLQRVPLATLGAVDMSQGDVISSGSALYLDAAGNVHCFYLVNGSIDPRNQIRIYHSNGSPVDTLGWGTPDAYFLCDPSSFGSTVLEDEATGRVWRIASGVGGLKASEFTFDAMGVYVGAPVILDASLISAHYVLSPATGKAYLDNTAFNSDTQVASITSIGGAVTGAVVRTFFVYTQPTVYQGGKVYTADASGVNEMDMASGASSQLVAEVGITAIDVVAGDVFYATPAGTYQRDSAGNVSLYAPGPVEIEAVTE